jgi:excisionase family DNA binding protein
MNSPAFYTLAEVCALLRHDRRTILRAAREGRLPMIRLGRDYRFPVEALRAVLSGTSRGACQVIRAAAAVRLPGPAVGVRVPSVTKTPIPSTQFSSIRRASCALTLIGPCSAAQIV